ncbi:MAG: hypothetical protein M3Z16_11365, partial [Pseudomonadota bacterium]|nr:hypothetical protein [Pseudomonadota bacterium]
MPTFRHAAVFAAFIVILAAAAYAWAVHGPDSGPRPLGTPSVARSDAPIVSTDSRPLGSPDVDNSFAP